ncbi:hypothetical protein CCAN11_2480007 [Capnocytophaga canimorsus]|uniref:Uncharacterized protein n=1 Tax=Capnocytophaga canimorsus TaxID=28188 RepID=A0A0B7IRC4_9FLAO|nr:hypothetical protein CCAN11_2480007 [Capnocytophaga canimorsus]
MSYPIKTDKKEKYYFMIYNQKLKNVTKTNLEQKLITQAKDKNWNLDYINKDGYRQSL